MTKPYEFIGFRAMEVTKPYEFIGFGAMDVTKPYEFIRFGAMHTNSTNKTTGAHHKNVAALWMAIKFYNF